jgi:hypothetical protein
MLESASYLRLFTIQTVGDLAKLYSKRLKVSFGGNEKEQDHLIEAKTRQVTKVRGNQLRQCRAALFQNHHH